MAACVAVIHGGGNIPRYHDFGGLLAFSIELAVQGLIRTAVEPQIPIKSILGWGAADITIPLPSISYIL